MTTAVDRELKLFTTCPASALAESRTCLRRLRDVAAWSENAGCEGMLVFSDNRQLDPWLVSQIIVEATQRLSPLVAVQPAYMHPYTLAKMLTSFAFLHQRRLHLNMVAGGFKNDLLALNDQTPHDERYMRLIEYTRIVQQLMRSNEAVTFEGRYYKVNNLKLTPPLPADLVPGVLVSGSSPAGREAAQALGAVPVEYPAPAAECATNGAHGVAHGMRIGLIVRDDEDEAWQIARQRYPVDRKGQITRELATRVSDSHWHEQLSQRGAGEGQATDPYWLVPFQNYKAMCPYLVGSYERVAGELARYLDGGYRTFILDEPASDAELEHIGVAFERAAERRVPA